MILEKNLRFDRDNTITQIINQNAVSKKPTKDSIEIELISRGGIPKKVSYRHLVKMFGIEFPTVKIDRWKDWDEQGEKWGDKELYDI